MSTNIWCPDFSAPTVSDADRGIFIHEFMHVWQYYHGITKASALWLLARYRGNYDPLAYRYDLSDSDNLLDYNIEQQAALIQDWWRIKSTSLGPANNRGSQKTEEFYTKYIDQMRRGGAPFGPGIMVRDGWVSLLGLRPN